MQEDSVGLELKKSDGEVVIPGGEAALVASCLFAL